METYSAVKQLLVEELKIDEGLIRPEAELVSDLELNSLELAEFILTCEEKFGVEISDSDLKSLVNVSDIVDYISRHSS